MRDSSLLTFLTEFKMLLPDGGTLQSFQAVVKSRRLDSSISVRLAQKKKTKEMRFFFFY